MVVRQLALAVHRRIPHHRAWCEKAQSGERRENGAGMIIGGSGDRDCSNWISAGCR